MNSSVHITEDRYPGLRGIDRQRARQLFRHPALRIGQELSRRRDTQRAAQLKDGARPAELSYSGGLYAPAKRSRPKKPGAFTRALCSFCGSVRQRQKAEQQPPENTALMQASQGGA